MRLKMCFELLAEGGARWDQFHVRRLSWCHCHPVISSFIKIQIGLTFLVPAYPGGPEK